MNYKSLEERFIYLDVLRIIAAFAVITLHVSATRFYASFPSTEWEFCNIYDSLSRWGVPIFVMISGALFLDQNKTIIIKKLYSKNITRIFCALVFWSFIYQLYKTNADTTLWSFLSGVVKGPKHLWFLKMLLGLYVAIPILRAIVRDKKTEIYFLIVAFITAYIIPLFPKFIGIYDAHLKTALEDIIKTIDLNIAMGFTGYFVLGHFLHTTELSSHIKRILYILGILSFLCVIILTSWFSHFLNWPNVSFYRNMFPLTIVEASAIFVFASDKLNKIPDNYIYIVLKLSKLTFGIYLIHYLIKIIANDLFGLNSSICNAGISIPSLSLLIFIISCILTWILSKIQIVNRYFI